MNEKKYDKLNYDISNLSLMLEIIEKLPDDAPCYYYYVEGSAGDCMGVFQYNGKRYRLSRNQVFMIGDTYTEIFDLSIETYICYDFDDFESEMNREYKDDKCDGKLIKQVIAHALEDIFKRSSERIKELGLSQKVEMRMLG